MVAALAIGAAAPVLGFGLLWVEHGGWLLPNSLLIKGVAPADSANVAAFLSSLFANLRLNAHGGVAFLTVFELILLIAAFGLMRVRRGATFSDPRVLFAGVAIAASTLQLVFASVGWLFRYEAWIVALDTAAAILLLDSDLRGNRRGFALALICLSIFLAPRALLATIRSVMAVNDRRLEHVLPATFVHGAYRGRAVIVNDVGAMSYYGGARALDIYGLGENEPVHMRRRPHRYDAASLANWAQSEGAAIAILEVSWKEVWNRLPSQWRLIELWRVPRNVVFGDRCIGFFAVMPGEDAHLKAALDRFPIPRSIAVQYPPVDLAPLGARGWLKERCGVF